MVNSSTKRSKNKEIVHKCGKPLCESKVDDINKAISCALCKKWFHPLCAGLEDENTEYLKSVKSVNIFWKCETCILDIPSMITLLNKIDMLEKIVTTRFDNIESKMSKQNKISVLSNSVEVQTDYSKKHLSVAVQTATHAPSHSEEGNPQTPSNLLPLNVYPCDLSRGQSSIAVQTASIAPPPGIHVGNRQSSSNFLPQNICPHYKRGKCRHGASGKYLIEGKECSFSHPRKCLKFCRHGSDNIRGCVGPCENFHPFLCKNSVNFKECLKADCTFAHLLGTKRQNTISQFSQDGNTRYTKPRYVRSPDPYVSSRSRVIYPQNSSVDHYQRDPINLAFPKHNTERHDLHYNRNNFPSLPFKEESKITQNSNDISELRHSISYLMQNVGSSKPQNLTGNLFRTLNQDIPCSSSGVIPNVLHSQQAKVDNSKNYLRLNHHYPME